MGKGRAVAVLLLDDGELDDVYQILQDEGISFGHVRGEAIAPETPPPRDLLIATPRRITAVRELETKLYGREPMRIVVVNEDSVTLRTQLRRLGFDYMIRRPVHPEALRLLILRCLYSGRERRREPRVPVGAEVSFRSGVRRHKGTLVDLSTGGCRILSDHRIRPGRRIQIQIPGALANGRGAVIAGHVIRSTQDSHLELDGLNTAAIRFTDLSDEQRELVDRILVDRAAGPAMIGEPIVGSELEPVASPRVRPARKLPPAPAAPDRAATEPAIRPADEPALAAAPAPAPKTASAPAPAVEPAPVPVPPPAPVAKPALPEPDEAEDEEEEDDGGLGSDLFDDEDEVLRGDLGIGPDLWHEDADLPTDPEQLRALAEEEEEEEDDTPTLRKVERRGSRRALYPRKVTGIGDKASRVLICRDLSARGVRIEAIPELEVGDRLHLALYDVAAAEPVLLWGRVIRDDGEGGMALRFEDLPAEKAERLEKLVAALPAVESLHDDEARAMGTIVGEILES